MATNPTLRATLTVLAHTLLALAAVALTACDAGAQTTTVIVVRHAERADVEGRDPPLSEAGEARARALAATLADAGIAAIYATPYRRTRDTATPLAQQLGLEVRTTPIENGIEAHIQDVARRIRQEHAGQAVVVVGHSNTAPRIVQALTGIAVPDLTENEYGDLFVVELPASGPPRLIRARFGRDPAPET